MATSATSARNTKSSPAALKWIILGSIALVIVTGVAAYFVGRSLRPYQVRGLQLEPPLPATDFTMTSSRTEKPASLSDFQDKIVLLYFGYTTCPDVCPASLSHYTESYNMLSNSAKEHVQFLWITVDPERDTPEIMEEYTSHFVPEFMLGLIPRSQEELAATAKAYSSYYEKIDYGSEAGYLMDHSAGVALIDTNGMWRIIYSFNTLPEDVAADLEYLVKTEIQN